MPRLLDWGSTLDALRNRGFRWLWLGGLASSATFQMGSVAQGWLVYKLTGSGLALGWVAIGWSIAALLLSPWGGVMCDRMEKRDILVWARTGMALNSLVIGLLISLNAIQVWHLALSSLFTGVVFAFLMPAQQAIIADLVDRRTMLNAISINAIGMGLMGMSCASLAGQIIDRLGVQGVYYAMAGLYVLGLLTLLKLPRTGRGCAQSKSVWRDLLDGMNYLLHSPALLAVTILSLSRVIFAQPYTTLMPKYAQDDLGFQATGLGLLLAAPGLGGTLGSLWAASLGDLKGKGQLFQLSGVILGAALLLFAIVRPLPLVFLFLIVVGAAGNICMVANTTLVQVNSATQYRGRMMSIALMMWGLTPLGTIPAGAIADKVGVPLVVAGQGILVVLSFVGMFLLRPEMKHMD